MTGVRNFLSKSAQKLLRRVEIRDLWVYGGLGLVIWSLCRLASLEWALGIGGAVLLLIGLFWKHPDPEIMEDRP